MAEESMEPEKSMVGSSPSGTPSPRGSFISGNIGTKDTSNGCVVSSTGTSIVTDSGDISTGTGEGTLATRTTTANVGTVAHPALSSTTSSSATPSSTWALASDATTALSISVPGGGGGIASIVHSGSEAKNNGGRGSPHSPKLPRKSRVKLSELQLESATREEWAAKWREQDLYVECLEAQVAAQEGELACLRDSEEKYKQQCFEISHRERILVRRLASKEQQLLGYLNQITELKASQTASASALRSALLDPAVNILVQKLRQELLSTKAKLEDTQNELSAWKFTPDSNTGKRLMAKCRLLYQENEELGRMIASGRIAKLEGELMLQKSFSEEVKKSQSELDEFLQDLDEDVEGMQSTIYFLQQELRKARESVGLLQQENNAFKSMSTSGTSPLTVPPQPPPQVSPPQAPPPTTSDNTGQLNGVTAVVPKAAPTNDDNINKCDARLSGDSKLIDPVKTDSEVHDERDRCGEGSGKRTPMSMGITPTTSSFLSGYESKSDSPEKGRCRLDEPDDSSNDSAALIIKVENEELSDREEDEEEGAAPSEVRGALKQTRRTIRDRTIIKNESVVDNRSNGGDNRSSSRPASRRLLRERTTKRDKSAADSDDERPLHKKKRRESILSLDYTETDDDAILLTNGESIQSDPEDGP
ncbi:pre-mRNA-splicing regulator WTAP-like [Venturia canescens]|uniref:pre-mRNA-splicing regulator WTAP-like n=1 Tax=Venturia canescens TaxID=32260 RepID=UPI001C9C19EA|nr:pre-mRNA-splicing regulator WTAP-like [Venturia canescens]XP_043280563.1 pre-mRNA-splicing regulator WTAP-like [Venturia canescens]XP_043280564.1 pre-mRNA-splicing regulator WTAP-like [Venturia canescens]XP_043280565.1 pre-mRNA-splicing regulator WTAP-like [Venturia canescens]XP_043280566.1 pre-mRNA-splicing regulator WTAP-like [Venturia canescens]